MKPAGILFKHWLQSTIQKTRENIKNVKSRERKIICEISCLFKPHFRRLHLLAEKSQKENNIMSMLSKKEKKKIILNKNYRICSMNKLKPWQNEDQCRTIHWWTRSNQRSNLQRCQHQRCRSLPKLDFG